MDPLGEERKILLFFATTFLLSFVVSRADGYLHCFSSGKKRKTALRSGDIPGTIPAAGVNDF